jgi:hypothetical protein
MFGQTAVRMTWQVDLLEVEDGLVVDLADEANVGDDCSLG